MKLALSEDNRMYGASTTLKPAPAATPLTEAIMGLGVDTICSIIGLYFLLSLSPMSSAPTFFLSSMSSFRSSPAEKPLPAPVITTTRTPASEALTRSASENSLAILSLIALSTPGLLKVIFATPPPTVYVISAYSKALTYPWTLVHVFRGMPPSLQPYPRIRRPYRTACAQIVAQRQASC